MTIKHKTAISYNVISNKNGLKWQSFFRQLKSVGNENKWYAPLSVNKTVH